MANYYTEKNLMLFRAALEAARNNPDIAPHISRGNSKIFNTLNVSLLPFITCDGVHCSSCRGCCYAAKLAALRPSVRKAWAENTIIAIVDQDRLFDAIQKAINARRRTMARRNDTRPIFFRWHVGGDIPNMSYFFRMIVLAMNNPDIRFLAYTRRYEYVAGPLNYHWDYPKNLRLILSVDDPGNCAELNPRDLPTAAIIHRGDDTPQTGYICPGDCAKCQEARRGCWYLNGGDVVYFHEH